MNQNVPKKLCNDLNRLAAINIISLGIDKASGSKINIQEWKDEFLRDIGVLMIYHQVLAWIPERFDSELVDDLTKTAVLMIIPNIQKPDWNNLAMILGLVVVYHKVVRSSLIQFLHNKGIGFDEGIEDMVETLLMLAASRDKINVKGTVSELLSLGIYHSYMKHQ
jgi:hypothetical protein